MVPLKEVRTITQASDHGHPDGDALRLGSVWFAGIDVCSCIGLNTTGGTGPTLRRIPAAEKMTVKRSKGETRLFPAGHKGHTLTMISESGLYQLITGSTKPDAKPFQELVFSTILPTIRKTGSYVMGEEKIETVTASDDLNTLQEQIISLMEKKAGMLEKHLTEARERVKARCLWHPVPENWTDDHIKVTSKPEVKLGCWWC
ncbi:BRO-N domain-containing protein [Acetobacter oeni]|uniref:Bro-N domain-containing protein n=1 Tax=Acetobacter oeni TaxID=304077 RepID=A0A511XNQ4_9PROT|nr:BRO family protein [Acetobacter oeni]MBB3884427.1 prophage antirepressor-like protein [Acetobacter oeni]NHO20353.1 hypothetical protein [Acetobacter oeni]GBR09913.1 hypothetical protein AA21952_2950 [Acetobacter oeni LMG 21952]GEN64574.1 hypothetical protein AOE01nite_27980 [Acetobacter oeni]